MHRMLRSAQGRGPIFVLKMWGFFFQFLFCFMLFSFFKTLISLSLHEAFPLLLVKSPVLIHAVWALGEIQHSMVF